MIAQFDQGGLGLPDREYYLKDDAKSVELRQKYVAHVQRMLELAGEKPDRAKADAAAVMQFETALAKGSLDLRLAPRSREGLPQDRPSGTGRRSARTSAGTSTSRPPARPPFQTINVTIRSSSRPSIPWWRHLAGRLEDLPHLATAARSAPLLPAAFVAGEFQFLRQDADGTEAMRPRWKRCVDFTDQRIGRSAGPQVRRADLRRRKARQRTLKMVDALEKALGQDIEQARLDDAGDQGSRPWSS